MTYLEKLRNLLIQVKEINSDFTTFRKGSILETEKDKLVYLGMSKISTDKGLFFNLKTNQVFESALWLVTVKNKITLNHLIMFTKFLQRKGKKVNLMMIDNTFGFYEKDKDGVTTSTSEITTLQVTKDFDQQKEDVFKVTFDYLNTKFEELNQEHKEKMKLKRQKRLDRGLKN